MRNHLLKSIFISLILVMGITNAWAVDFTGGKIYFRNDVTNWTTSNIQIFAHQSGYTWVSDPMSKVPDTKLCYINASCNWGGFVSYRICGNSSKWGSGGFTNQSSSSKYTGTNNSYGLNGGSIYLITPASANNGCAITPEWYGSNNDFLKYKATVKAKTSTDGSNYTTISSGNWPATITIKGTYLSGDGTTARSDVATNKGASGSYDAVATGLITMTYSSLNSEYAFVGWGTTENAPSSTSESYEYNIGQATIVYAFFKKKYTITFDANGHGTAPSSQTIIAGAKATEPAEPAEAGYTFGGWYKDADCTNAFDFNTAITNNVTLYAKWTQNATYSLTVVAGNGISQVAGSKDPVTLGNTYDIKATPKTGYTFSTWTANPTANATFGSETTANTTVTVNNGSVIVTASATENMSTLTTSNKYDAGDPGYEVPAASVNSIGYETIAEVTAAAAGNGYTFKGWTLTNCTRTDGGAADATSIIVRSNGDGNAATVTANYTEVLTTGWYLAGEFSNKDDKDTGWSTNQIEFKKLSGESSGTVSYITLDLLPTTFTDEYNMSFKLVNGDWYGNDGEYKKANDKQDWQFETGKGNCNLDVSLPGTYTFCLNTNKDGKVYLNIAYPVVNQLQVYSADPAHPEAIANWEWDIKTGDKYSKTLTLNEETKYTFKAVVNSEFYGKSTTLKRSSSSAVLNTSDGDVTLATDIAGDYKFEFNASTKELSVDYPVSDYDYYISGSVNDWAKYDNGYGMTETSANTYEKTLTLQAGDHTFKVHQLAGDWYGWSDIDNTDFIELSNDGDNIKLTLTNTTDVTIKFDSNTKKISFEGLTAVTYTDITVQLYTEESAPQIWWWGSDGEQSKDAEDTYDYDTNAPTMNAVAGEDNWYEWTIKDVATHSGVIVRFKKSSTQSADYTVYENTCFDGRDLANTRTTTCGEVPTTCLDCSGIYLKGTFNEWLPDNEFKKTSDPNVVTLSINLTKGNHEFKIHGDEWYGNTGNLTRENTEQAWTYNKDEDKTPFRVDVAGDYKFSWNISEHKLTVTYPEFPVISNQPEKIYFLPNTSWKTADATFAAFFLDGDKGTAAKWVAFTDADGDGMYELTNDKKYLTVIFCRMNPNGTDTDNWKNKWNQSADITIPNASYLNCWIDDSDTWDDATGTWAMPLSSGDNSAAITAAAEAGQTVTALVNRSFTQGDGWYTLTLPFNMNAALIGEAYQLSGLVRKTGEYVEVNLEKTSTISAGQPYLILPNENKSYLLVDNVTIKTTETSITKSISGLSVSMQAIINGANEQTTTEYWVGNSGMLYNTPTKKLGLRALFNITSSSGIAPRMRVVAGENVETGVEDIITTDAPVKVIENGQLIIIRGGVKYNVQGQKL